MEQGTPQPPHIRSSPRLTAITEDRPHQQQGPPTWRNIHHIDGPHRSG
jgi:hypothetical protein